MIVEEKVDDSLRLTHADNIVWANYGQWNNATVFGTWTNYTFETLKEINRVVERFLWIPLKLKNEWKWLCKCYIKQFKTFPFNINNLDWVDYEFLSQSEYLEWRIVNE